MNHQVSEVKVEEPNGS